jgi:hypothetical protein
MTDKNDTCGFCGFSADSWSVDCKYPGNHSAPQGVRKEHATRKPPLGADMVVLPKHYARFNIEPINFVASNNIDFLTGNAIKYLCRAPYKHGDGGRQDYMKALRYTIMLAKRALGDPEWWKPYKTDIGAKILEELSYAAEV